MKKPDDQNKKIAEREALRKEVRGNLDRMKKTPARGSNGRAGHRNK